MFDRTSNETDVREDLIVPFLKELGYQRGSANNIEREVTIKYEAEFLGRKKKSDPPLRGRPDYVLSVLGAGRWVLEVKAPNQPLDSEVIGQALSYAKHPEISAGYAVTTNGRRLKIHSAHQTALDDPICEISVSTPEDLAFSVTGFLSPQAIRRKLTPEQQSAGEPLAVGFPAQATVTGGEVIYKRASHVLGGDTPYQLRRIIDQELRERVRFLSGFQTTVAGGTVARDENGRIIAKLDIPLHREELNAFASENGIHEAKYICLEDRVSSDIENPSTFDVAGAFQVAGDQPIYDIISNRMTFNGFPTTQNYYGTATGYLDENTFSGTFEMGFDCKVHAMGMQFSYTISTSGVFSVILS
ncbi:MAG: type I restriction enzyme HsdR N-terminal domain-containing protein [Rhodobacteraceae bacterium]|nr:type I restriction enzyme HsdR N-terminal domain-containing protein [Paracoccaceae bacterium]